jgi:hypothetical protein
MRTWIWRHLSVAVPEAWELLQFSCDRAAGRCAFADRYRFRLEVSWRQVAGPPDVDRMLADYEARLTEQGMTEARRLQRGGWRGLGGRLDGQPMSRYGAYVPQEACVVEVVFIGTDAADAALEERVLASVRAEPPDAEGGRRWRAFGMDMRVPPGVDLAGMTVQPAHAEAHFAGPRVEVRFARRGLVPVWLRSPVDEWLRGWLPPDARRGTAPARALARGGHTVTRLEGRRRRGLLGPGRPFRAEAWLCPADGRLYSWIGTGAAFVRDGQGPLACCAAGAS